MTTAMHTLERKNSIFLPIFYHNCLYFNAKCPKCPHATNFKIDYKGIFSESNKKVVSNLRFFQIKNLITWHHKNKNTFGVLQKNSDCQHGISESSNRSGKPFFPSFEAI